MKKVFVVLFFIFTMSFLFACEKKVGIKDSFSEITYDYYSGISSDGGISASICVGEREEPYIIDGRHGKNCDFSLLTIKALCFLGDYQIAVEFYDANVKKDVILEFNPVSSSFMADLGYSLKKEGNYSIAFEGQRIEFALQSKQFEIGYEQAIEKSLNVLGENAEKYFNGGVFQGECYLKILTKIDDEEERLYWIFTIVGENQYRNNVVLDIQNGDIILVN